MRNVGPRGLLTSCLLVLVVGSACSEEAKPRGRVLLVGIDGATLRVARPLIRAGRLPNLARIAEEGVYGPLRAHLPLSSPRIWTSIATGKSPKAHGILGFAHAGEGGVRRLYQSQDRTAHALWNIASDAGLSVAVVNWWTTFPLEKVRGVVVSDHLLAGEIQGRRNLNGIAATDVGPLAYPEEWADRIEDLASAPEPLTEVSDPFSEAAAFPDWAKPDELSERYRNDEWITRIALAIEAEIHPDLMLVFLPGIDRVCHRLWGALEPVTEGSPFTPEQRVVSAEALRGYYQYTDALIGRLVARYASEDLVVVVPDHGFEAGSNMIFLTGQHKGVKALNGVLFARGPHVAQPPEQRPVSVNDITPTILAWLGLPVGEDMDGVPAGFLSLDPATVARVATHDTGRIERLEGGVSGAEERMLEHLESLGYMQADEAPPAAEPPGSAVPPAAAVAAAAPVSAVAIAAGGSRHFASFSHACAVVSGGLQCWGAGESGQLGGGLLARRSPRPLRTFAANSGVSAVTAGGVHTCAVVRDEVLCWGGNFSSQVGLPRPYIAVTPTPVPGLQGPVLRLSAGVDHTCAAIPSGVWCWGSNTAGQLGRPKCERRSRVDACGGAPAPVPGLAGATIELAAGRLHTCAAAAGGVQCWGDNRRGQLGDGGTRGRSEPAPVHGIRGPVTALAAGDDHTCALAADGVTCWGANDAGQLGDGSRVDRHEAALAALPAGAVTALAAGGDGSCAVVDGAVFCWGGGAAASKPFAVPGLARGSSALALGVDLACSLAAAGGVWCWGDNDFGQLGSGDAPLEHATPVRVVGWDDGRLQDRNGDGRITVACLGDSNTAARPEAPPSWCERLAELAPAQGFAFVNRGEGGATAVEIRSLITAAEHLDYTLENDAVDAVILAYGTNDLKISGADPIEVAYAYAHLRERAQAAGVDAFAALTPPVRSGIGGVDAEIAELNARLPEFFPATRLIDFSSGIEAADFIDEVHFSESGQAKRAQAAWAALSAAAGLAGEP